MSVRSSSLAVDDHRWPATSWWCPATGGHWQKAAHLMSYIVNVIDIVQCVWAIQCFHIGTLWDEGMGVIQPFHRSSSGKSLPLLCFTLSHHWMCPEKNRHSQSISFSPTMQFNRRSNTNKIRFVEVACFYHGYIMDHIFTETEINPNWGQGVYNQLVSGITKNLIFPVSKFKQIGKFWSCPISFCQAGT